MNPETKDHDDARILSERARRLAVATESAHVSGDCLNFVEFTLAGESYGIELKHILEVYAHRGLTPLPGIPPFIRGIINVRGTIVSVVDLKQFFGLAETKGSDAGHVIILSSEKMEFGILADTVSGVRNQPKAAVQPPIPTLSGIRARYLKGIIDGRVAILDGKKLLEDEQMRINPDWDL